MLRIIMIAVVLLAQQSKDVPRVYTAEQAIAGQRELQDNKFGACAECHAKGLSGRNGEKGEIPELTSLSEAFQTSVRNNGGNVPQLAGPKFMTRWGARSTKDFSLELKNRFSGPLDEETQLNVMAYILQLNGALPGPQPLTRSTDIEIGKLIDTSPK